MLRKWIRNLGQKGVKTAEIRLNLQTHSVPLDPLIKFYNEAFADVSVSTFCNIAGSSF